MKNTLSYKMPPPGTHVAIGDYSLHAQQMGQGQPTVVFENGLGGLMLQWSCIQAQVAQFTQTMSYDRAGQGWSDPSLLPRTPQQMTKELHDLLAALSLTPPYILVAHSFGGLLSRFFTRQYRDEVKGMVLVDVSHERQLEKSWAILATIR